ncbi:alpha/beta fold hydrolase [Pseudoclavibacter sp. CFCC 13796]|uniref:alpha/beta fold hydrolase n=1 Tax=Pseudoclavibacter sp. CFCC 13796 TaxID=2615179 RepID=UPI0013017DF8|nr:alpha/beta hydrolase [Pseudoclavibacter sp. CFCC 13796]KAB1660847.1 alpha/beta fold hydrolase [Pseudoclavibacter sp. CFCC 13796]
MSATPVVLLHGVGLDRTMWQRIQPQFAHQLHGDRDIIALDLPGHGEQPPLSRPTTLTSLADDVLTRMPEKRPVHLIGFSIGALIAEHIALFHPERVQTLTLVSSVFDRSPQQAAAVAERLERAQTDFESSVCGSLDRWFPAGTSTDPAIIDEIAHVLRANDVDSYLQAYAVFALADRELADELSQISQPTLVITGELDSGSTPEMTHRLALTIPDADKVIVPNARHMLPVEQPAEFLTAVSAFLEFSEGDQTS